MNRPCRAAFTAFCALLAACHDGKPAAPEGGASGRVPGVGLMSRLAGLWSGAATRTPLGTFPMMNIDLRAAGPRLLFGRVDLDAGDSLRFAFAVEEHGQPLLTFRNGGYFQGLMRDSRAGLVDVQEDRSFRFCSIDRGDRGCDYIDARFTFADETHLGLDVKVRGQQHVLWDPERKEPRPLPSPFPADEAPLPGDAPFPAMPRLEVTVAWDRPLARDADVWILLSQTECRYLTPADLGCTVSRSLSAPATAGSQGAHLALEQIHAGTYQGTAILDRGRTLKDRLFPQSGDGLSLPNQPIAVAPAGESTASVRIVYDLP